VGPTGALVRLDDSGGGYEVRDGQPATALTGPGAGSGSALPGPDPQHYWLVNGDGTAATLIGFDGSTTSTTLALPAGASPTTDGDGYLMFTGVGGTYDLTPHGARRITTGGVLASGPSKYLVTECSTTYACSAVVIDRRSGARQPVNVPGAQTFTGMGTISPDGRTAALLESFADAQSSFHLIDLSSGQDTDTKVQIDLNLSFGGGAFVWSPDDRWLFAAVAGKGMQAVDVQTGAVTGLNSSAGITQVALRTATN
jgi:hypothetical protein